MHKELPARGKGSLLTYSSAVYYELICLQVTGTQQQIGRDFKPSSLSIIFSGKSDGLGVAGRQVRGAPKPLLAAITAACAFTQSLLTPFHQ
jgi:hypothetical protein